MKLSGFLFAILSLIAGSAFAAEPAPIKVPRSLMDTLETFEPSGAAYLADLDKFLIVIDDTDKKSHALVFFMDRQGQLDADAAELTGVNKMSDAESVSVDEKGRILVLSSLSLNKKSKDKPERNMLIRSRRNGARFTVDETVNLRELLVDGIQNSKITGTEGDQENGGR